ncbi:MAG: hypothetical protein H6566_06170 [Lewinellaceae bacterium]|nr:hypothetical protein [Lewinellaceae bacterium]
MPGRQGFRQLPLEELTDYIDWTPFFSSWQLVASSRHPRRRGGGPRYRKLYNDARSMLRQIIDEGWLQTGRSSPFPANTVNDDDIEVYTDEQRMEVKARLHMLRQQNQKAPGWPTMR